MNYKDHAVKRKPRIERFVSIDENRLTATIKNYLNGEPGELVSIPIVFEVCHSCNGRGKILDPSLGISDLSPEKLAASGQDVVDAYNAGEFHINCHECLGARVLPNLDEDRASQPQLRVWISLLEEEAFEKDLDVHGDNEFGEY